MNHYTEEFRGQILKRMLAPKNATVPQLHRETGIASFNLARISIFATPMFLLFACGGSSDQESLHDQGNPQQYHIGVTVNNLNGGSLILQNSNLDTLEITQDGDFNFAIQLNDGENYHITVVNQPAGQNCNLTNASGVIAGEDVNGLIVNCHATDYRISGFVTGLTGSGLVLQNNGGDDLNIVANGEFSFPTQLKSGKDFLVSIATQPSNQDCTVINGSGTLSDLENTQVVISCPLSATNPRVNGINPKILRFTWNDVGADYYRLLKNPDGETGYSQVGDDITDTQADETISVHMTDWVNASYIVQACNGVDLCTDSSPLPISPAMIYAIGYLKASDIERNYLGSNLALSNDGTILAASSSAGIHIFISEVDGWRQQTVIDTPFTALSLAGDGNTLAVAYSYDTSVSSDINGDGCVVRIYTRTNDSWNYQTYLKSSNPNTGDNFGYAVALSHNGDILAVSARGEDSAATGVNGDQSDNSAPDSGAAYLFIREDGSWRQQAYVKPSNTDPDDKFGTSIALSADGSTLAVGAPEEQSDTTGINGNQSSNNASDAGAVYLFTQSEGEWTQQAYIKASNTDSRDFFGIQLALSDQGDILAVSATLESSSATGIDGDQTDNTADRSGAVYLFERSTDNTWAQTTYIKASNTDSTDSFGGTLALNDDGTILAVGTEFEGSIARGINGDQSDNTATRAGAVYLFSESNGSWYQEAYIKASNTRGDRIRSSDCLPNCPPINASFGFTLALSGNGSILAVSAPSEYSPDFAHQPIDAPLQLGAVYLY